MNTRIWLEKGGCANKGDNYGRNRGASVDQSGTKGRGTNFNIESGKKQAEKLRRTEGRKKVGGGETLMRRGGNSFSNDPDNHRRTFLAIRTIDLFTTEEGETRRCGKTSEKKNMVRRKTRKKRGSNTSSRGSVSEFFA